MTLRIAIPDLVSPSCFPLIAAVELGCFRDEGFDASLDLVFPVTKTYEMLRDGALDLAGGSAHAALYAFPDWQGGRRVFPPVEAELIAELVRRDAPFYDTGISRDTFDRMNGFAASIGLATRPARYEEAVVEGAGR
jgi:hypothetical protein